MSSEMQPEIDSAEICERLVGITPIYLQNFVQRGRGRYGLKASVQAGKWRQKRRLFSRDDVFGIALVWLLFESGLRSDPIIRILKEIAGTKQPKANLAAKKLLESQAEYLVVVRQPRGPTKTPYARPGQENRTVTQAEAVEPRAWNPAAVELLIPVGQKFRDIERLLEFLFPPQGA